MSETYGSGGGTAPGGDAGGTAPGDAGKAEPTAAEQGGGREWISQLQGMIDNLATQAAPVMREIGAKAAELAAAAGEKAGPIAHKAAEVTEAAGQRLAERGRVVANDLRRDAPEGGGAAEGDTPNAIQPGSAATASSPTMGSSTTTGSTAPGAGVSPAGSTTWQPDTVETVGE